MRKVHYILPALAQENQISWKWNRVSTSKCGGNSQTAVTYVPLVVNLSSSDNRAVRVVDRWLPAV